MTVDADRFGTDLLVPLDEDETLRVTPTGDLDLITGRDNLARALGACALTSTGSLVHRPTYGGGLADDVESAATPGNLSRASNRLRAALLEDPRLAGGTLDVTVAPGTPTDPRALGHITATIRAGLYGDPAPVVVTVTE